nr:E3 ubiquitin-protein ligase RLIM-like [Ipomoea batatas]GMC65123.1 E3 ubiquitin-protein ligase RLIM-like [Ipomoea batatas]
MGSGGSRLGAHPRPHRPSRTRSVKRTLSSLLICGASPSDSARDQIEDHSAELLINSAKHIRSKKLKPPSRRSAAAFTCSKIEIGVSSAGNVVDGPSNVNGSNTGQSFSENKEVAPNSIRSETTHTAPGDQPFPISLYRMENVDNSETASTRDDDGSLICAVSTQFSSPSHGGLESPSVEELLGNHSDDVIIFNNCDSASVSVVLDSPVTSLSPRDDFCQQTPPSFPELVVSEREQHLTDGGILHADIESISSNVHSSSSAESSHEPRRNNRRLFWDAFSRRRLRNNADSRTSVFSNDDSDDVGPHERWPHDLRGGAFHNGVGGNFRSHQNRSHGSNDQHHSRSEVQERLHSGITASNNPIANCPSGIHLDGACSCESVLMTDESGSRASISRIVMLAEALFEVSLLIE